MPGFGDNLITAYNQIKPTLHQSLERYNQIPHTEVARSQYNLEDNSITFSSSCFHSKKDFIQSLFQSNMSAISYHNLPFPTQYLTSNNVMNIAPYDFICFEVFSYLDRTAKSFLFFEYFEIYEEHGFHLARQFYNTHVEKNFSQLFSYSHSLFSTTSPAYSYLKSEIDNALMNMETQAQYYKDYLYSDNMRFTTLEKQDYYQITNTLNVQSTFSSIEDVPDIIEIPMDHEQKERLMRIEELIGYDANKNSEPLTVSLKKLNLS